MASVKRILRESLEDLSDEELRMFCGRLVDRDRDGQPRIKRRALKDKDPFEIADILVSTFTENYAGEVVVEILLEIECNQIAMELEKNLESESDSSSGESGGESDSDSDSTPSSSVPGSSSQRPPEKKGKKK